MKISIKSSKLFSYFLVALSIIILLKLIYTIKLNNQNMSLPKTKPNDFNFILNYGILGKNQIDTLNGKYTKDMITAPSIIIDFKLSEDDMNSIYEEMRNIKILKYPEEYSPSGYGIKPYCTYTLKIIFNKTEKTIFWDDQSFSNENDAVKLRSLFDKIHTIISGKEEYKKLPKPMNGYC